MSQNTTVLQHLKKHPITQLEATQKYGILRLAARVDDLRRRGHKIYTEMVEERDKRFARYHLEA